jgi:hypothetical protein
MLGLDGVGISNYRSFGPEVQRIGPLGKINLLIGQNNVGKSNILNFFAKCYRPLFLSANLPHPNSNFSPEVDAPNLSEPASWTYEIGLNLDGDSYRERMATFVRERCDTAHARLVEIILHSNALTNQTSVAWFKYRGPWGTRTPDIHPELIDSLVAEQVASPNEWEALFYKRVGGSPGGNIKGHWIPEVLKRLSPETFTPPQIILIPAIRTIGAHGSTPHDYSGAGIIERLAELQHPPHHKQSLKQHFLDINAFVQSVLGDPEATLEITHDKSAILVNKNRKTLPLQSHGTGLHEVITLGVAATVLNNSLLCIEEPELHLHPLLQKKLYDILSIKLRTLISLQHILLIY